MSSQALFRLAADYHCHATWKVSASGSLENVAPNELGLAHHLELALQHWATAYTSTLNGEDPASSGFATEAEHEFFCAWGRALAQILADELGQSVEYFDDMSGTFEIVR